SRWRCAHTTPEGTITRSRAPIFSYNLLPPAPQSFDRHGDSDGRSRHYVAMVRIDCSERQKVPAAGLHAAEWRQLRKPCGIKPSSYQLGRIKFVNDVFLSSVRTSRVV